MQDDLASQRTIWALDSASTPRRSAGEPSLLQSPAVESQLPAWQELIVDMAYAEYVYYVKGSVMAQGDLAKVACSHATYMPIYGTYTPSPPRQCGDVLGCLGLSPERSPHLT
jgi:hypothetical protein